MKANLIQFSKALKAIFFVLLLSVAGTTKADAPVGAINGIFSVSENTQVYFSQGNLQYQASTNTWRFAENQYNYIGNPNTNVSSTYSGWIDLFGWGTSGYHNSSDPYNTYYYPYSTSTSVVNSTYNRYGYGPSTNMTDPNLTNTSANYDWGVYNSIINGGNTANTWRVLTQAEWNYVLNTRVTTSGIRYAKARVNYVNGLILLPDNWSASTYSLNNTNSSESSFNSNSISGTQWITLENAGAVFLPAAGNRYGTSIEFVGSYCLYWSDSYENSLSAYNLYCGNGSLSMGSSGRCYGLSVRLVSTVSTIPNPPVGGSNDLFSVSGNTQVYFSSGNLQYQASTNTWRFAENQWDYVGTQTPYSGNAGGTVGGSDNGNISSTYNGWIDLFCWGTSGYNHGANCYQPWSLSTSYDDYYAYGNHTYNLYDQTGKADWGYNPIINGENTNNMWRTLSQSEWDYVFNTRTTSSGIRFAKAQVNNVNGVILLPDDWSISNYSLNNANNNNASFGSNVITTSQWSILEDAGAIFLPAAGMRYGTSVTNINTYGWYWSASCSSNSGAGSILFYASGISSVYNSSSRSYGESVRLVRTAQASSYNINVTPNPAEGGTVLGAGTYDQGATATLIATANPGYTFVNWTKNGEVVSTNSTYSFAVTETGDYVANFISFYDEYFTIESLEDNNTITLSIPSDITYNELNTVSYSIDKTNWTTLQINYTYQTISVTLDFGDKVYFKGIGYQYGKHWYDEDEEEDEYAHCSISASGNFNVYGNIMSLLYGDNFVNQTAYGRNYTFYGLFLNNTYLISAENLRMPATTLKASCYLLMFSGCTSLTTAPMLPATSLDYSWYQCYQYMFNGCTSLITAPELPASTLAYSCYDHMFSGCSSLMTAPELPATTLASYCYHYMFSGCSSLTVAPELPATSLASYCYHYMFSGCSSLTAAPELPATTLKNNCYRAMFSGCTSLTTTPVLPATVLASYCYSGMFSNCTSLTMASELPAMTLADYCYSSMFSGCTSMTTTPELPATILANSCYSNMFSSCTSLTTAPELPATVLANSCYSSMFSNCTSLTMASELPAMTLADYCYSSMFSGCASLTIAPELPAITLAVRCYYNMFAGCASLIATPELLATTLASYCYFNMFSGCTSLITVPELPAIILADNCYHRMFYHCTSLTTTPVLPAITLANSCYTEMFKNCSLINEITCWATDISATNCTKDWLIGVASTGTFHKNREMQSWTLNSSSGIPEGWTVIDYNHEITATANPIEGGTVTGMGIYNHEATATLTATANEGYTFINWTKNGEEVSTEAVYSFTVTESATYVANFRIPPFYFTTAGNWSTASNWQSGTLPGATDEVFIDAPCQLDQNATVATLTVSDGQSLTLQSGKILTVTGNLTNTATTGLVIEDGAQLVHNVANVQATVRKAISQFSGTSDGWHLIALPLTGSIDVDSVVNLLEGEYDLYSYDETTAYWRNQKHTERGFTVLEAMKGYLYANSAEVTLGFSGTLENSSDTITVPLSYTNEATNEADLSGFNLVGNPFPCNAYLDREYYVLSTDGSDINPEPIPANTPIPPCTAVFVKAVAEGETVVFTRVVQ